MSLADHELALNLTLQGNNSDYNASSNFHAVHHATFGRSLSLVLSLAEGMDVRAHEAEQALFEVAMIRADRVHPRHASRLRRAIGQPVMTREEASIVDAAANFDPSLITAYRGVATNYYRGVHDQMPNFRRRLCELSPKQMEILDEYCEVNTPPELRLAKQTASPKSSWADWLKEPEAEIELRDFLKWHVKHIANMQTASETQQEIEKQKNEYKSQILQGIFDGWLHSGAVRAIEKVDGIKVYIGDIFDTLMQDRGGYHARGSSEVIIAAPIRTGRTNDQKAPLLTRNLKRTTKHELNHAVLGHLGERWLNEALTQHIAVSLQYGQPEIMNPWEREVTDIIYESERETLDFLLTKGKEIIPVCLATRAYSNPRIPNQDLVELEMALLRSWGHLTDKGQVSILEIVDNHVSDREKRIRRDVQKANDGSREFKHIKGITELEIQKMAMALTVSDLRAETEKFFTQDLEQGD